MTEPLDWARFPVDALDDRRLRNRVIRWERSNAGQGRMLTSTRDAGDLLLEVWSGDAAPTHARAIDSFTSYPGLEEQLLAAHCLTSRPWPYPSIREALGVPAIFGAAAFISNQVGSLTMRALRNEVELPPSERPRLIIRPDPFRIPREFY